MNNIRSTENNEIMATICSKATTIKAAMLQIISRTINNIRSTGNIDVDDSLFFEGKYDNNIDNGINEKEEIFCEDNCDDDDDTITNHITNNNYFNDDEATTMNHIENEDNDLLEGYGINSSDHDGDCNIDDGGDMIFYDNISLDNDNDDDEEGGHLPSSRNDENVLNKRTADNTDNIIQEMMAVEHDIDVTINDINSIIDEDSTDEHRVLSSKKVRNRKSTDYIINEMIAIKHEFESMLVDESCDTNTYKSDISPSITTDLRNNNISI